LDAITFTAGIGENSPLVRARVCRDVECVGARLDEAKNCQGPAERPIHTPDSKVQILIIPTDEEIIVARDAVRLLSEAI
jgi:acetate kinase